MALLEWTGAVVLTTPRLVLHAFRRDDLPHYAALNADLEVMRYLGGVLTRESSDQMAVWAQERHAREGTRARTSGLRGLVPRRPPQP